MENVVSLLHFKGRETIAVLRFLTRVAMRGELHGLALCALREGKIEYAFTGVFKTDHAATCAAANRIAWKMNQAMDSTESSF